MATLQKLRNRGPLLVIFIGLGLMGFILMDFFEQGGFLFGGPKTEVAEISGKSIPYQEYQQRIDHLAELNKASRRETSLDQETLNSLSEEVWNQIVQEYVLGPSYRNLGIAISSDELFDMVQGRNIHPIIRQEFGNPQTGQVDTEMVIQFLRNMDADPSGLQKAIWLYLEDLIKRDRLYTKYSNLIMKGVFVTDFHADRSATERSKRADFSYLVARYNTIEDNEVTVTSSEIRGYYRANKHKFKQEASRDIEYVVFPIEPSKDDFQKAEQWIHQTKNEFIQAEDVARFTNLSSDRPFDNRYYKQGELPSEEFDQWAFNAQVNDYHGPIFDGDSYTIARLVDIAHLPDSVRARHILVGGEVQTQQEFDRANALADSLYDVIRRGGNFARIAREYSEDPGSAMQGGDLGWFREGQMVQPFNDACFAARRGDILRVQTQFGIHIIEVQELGRLSKKVQVAFLQRDVTPSTQTYQQTYQRASLFAGTNRTPEEFDNAVKEQRLSKRIASNIRESDRRIAGLENPREMIRWAYSAKVNQVSDRAFEIGDNFVVAILKDAKEDGVAPMKRVEADIRQTLVKDKKAEVLKEKLSKAMANAADINDLASELSLSVENASRISFASFTLPAVGAEPAIIATAVNSPEGEMVGPVKGNNGVYVLSVNAINIEELDETGERRRLRNLLTSRAMREPYEAIKENANIVDRRARFF